MLNGADLHALLPHQVLADAVLVVHFGVVVFVVGGLLVIVVGNWLGWRWVNRLWLRIAHLASIATVVAEAWLGVTCPLTVLESWLREQTGVGGYGQSFIEHWVQRALYFDAPPWVFTVSYSLFGLLVAATWWYFPPGSGKSDRSRLGDSRSNPRG
jgi:polyferredoxin